MDFNKIKQLEILIRLDIIVTRLVLILLCGSYV